MRERASRTVTIDGSRAIVRIDSAVYSADVVFRSLYWLTDRAYAHVSQTSDSFFEVSIEPKDGLGGAPRTLAGEFLNALIDYSIRASIQRETAQLRDMIVAKAFAEPGLLEDTPPGDVHAPARDATSDDAEEST